LVVVAGSSGTKTLANRSANSVTYSGTITANDDLTIAGAYTGGRLTISGTANTIASGKTVSFSGTGTSANTLTHSAIWSGDGSISYTSTNNVGFAGLSGSSTYSGGTTLGAMSGAGILTVGQSSSGPANAPTSGPFGTGPLTIGATKMRGGTGNNVTNGNPIIFTGNPTFTTQASEKSLIFSGDASLGATRTLTVDLGSTVPTAAVEFSGVISGSGFGIDKQGAGNLVLSGTNTYTGDTTVSGGKLVIAVASLAPSSTVRVAEGAVLELNFAETNIVAGFVTNGVSLPPGVYNSALGNAGSFITGAGSLQVAAGPSSPATLTNSVSGGVLSLSWPAGQGWRLEQQTNALSVGLSTNWAEVAGSSVSSTNFTIDSTKPTVFYRLIYP
jgi:autotransporter-associated beta strand protein